MYPIQTDIDSIFFDFKDFDIRQEIGSGQFGTVYKITSKNNQKKYAIKCLKLDTNDPKDNQISFLRELLILHDLNHPAIVKFIGGSFVSFNDPNKFEPSIVTEFIQNGKLTDYIEKNNLDPTQKMIILLGIVHAMKYCHAKGITHRDLKLDNILLDENFYPRICDFGLSRSFPTSISNVLELKMSNCKGTPIYFAPEKIKDKNNYGPPADVYAFSLIAYSIVTGKEPFFDLIHSGMYDFYHKITKEKIRPKFDNSMNVSNEMKNLISRCWDDDPAKRPTFDEIYKTLSTNIHYLNPDVDDTKINNYIQMLHNIVPEYSDDIKIQNIQLNNKNGNLQDEIKELKEKVNNYSSTNENFFILLNRLNKYKLDQEQSIQFFKDLSEKGNSHASYILGLYSEKNCSKEEDYNKSISYYEKSSQQGNSSGYFKIGLIYQKLNKDGIATEYFKKSSKMGHIKAMFYLADIYKKGGAYIKAKEWYEKAGILNDSDALNQMGYLYKNGFGVEKNIDKAEDYFLKSANLGNSSAFINLSSLYQSKDNADEVIKCLEKASELNNDEALRLLGKAYEKGYGNIRPDLSQAKVYYQKSRDLGNQKAQKKLKKINMKTFFHFKH